MDVFIGPALTAFENGKELFYQGRFESALEQFSNAQQMQTAGQSAVLENWTANTYVAMGNHPQAIAHFSNAVDIEDSGFDRTGRAMSYAETKQWDLMAQDAEAALALDAEWNQNTHSHAEAHALLAVKSLMHEEASLAYDHSTQALAIMDTMEYDVTSRAAVLTLKGRSQTALGHPDRAAQSYSESLAYIDSAQVRMLRANTYLAENRCPEATADAEAALSMEPAQETRYHSDADAHSVLGYCNYQDGNLADADQELTEAVVIMHQTGYSDEETHYWTDLLIEIRQRMSQ